ncbi:hypothetical protein L228DRAFT_240551 [Xylona heveae TC161]|uniref:F-box domain-containing protein n=1 Tax=Xylona heveae (strain CBS 132557 / TC161) TaxID=1328760 RepID=A0A165FBX6_XYLHT|nr:hypothetical protein L228DRAFT_240551 [Xylona heveae TC161]KZF20801.1 hypothetical protein L228DRAFT_240551 [Xylona heveae TC161]
MLTPIRVRGKRKHNDSKRPRIVPISNPKDRIGRWKIPSLMTSSATSSAGTPGGPSSQEISDSQRIADGARPRKRRRKIRISPLESLPPEILQLIFFYAMNLDLPLASPRLASLLSSEHVYTKLCLSVFRGCWDEPQDVPGDELGQLQSRILECRWLTLELLRKCERKYYSFLLENKKQQLGIQGEGEQEALDAHLSMHPPRVPWIDCGITVDEYRYLWPIIAWENFSLPERLLRGPWAQEKVILLYKLCLGGAYIDWKDSNRGEFISQGLIEAIQEGNATAVRVITLLMPVLGDGATDMLKQAVIESDCNREVVKALIAADQSSSLPCIQWGDADLWRWATARRDEGVEKGFWLLDILRRGMFEDELHID